MQLKISSAVFAILFSVVSYAVGYALGYISGTDDTETTKWSTLR